MPKTPTEQLDLLLVEGGRWLVGLDATLVLRVDPPGSPHDSNVAGLASLLGCDDAARPHQRRILRLVPDGRRSLLVDKVVQMHAAAVSELQPLPALLHHVGVPKWLLGSCWSEDRLVLLLEPVWALHG
jgi:hypothetical protein